MRRCQGLSHDGGPPWSPGASSSYPSRADRCRSDGRFRPVTAPSPAREAGLNVLLVTVDTLRADALGAYGKPARRHAVDRPAGRAGVRFTNAHAHNVVTLPSHANILSGRSPIRARRPRQRRLPLPADTLDTLATLLKARGYRTGAFVSAFPLDSRFGLERGFDVYDDRFARRGARPRSSCRSAAARRRWPRAGLARRARRARRGSAGCTSTSRTRRTRRREPFAARFAEPYHGEVAAADAALAAAAAAAARRRPRRPDAGRADRRSRRVARRARRGDARPLRLRGDAARAADRLSSRGWRRRRVDTPARHVDILPTILDALASVAAGPARPEPAAGVAGPRATAAPPTYFEALSAALNRRWAPLDGVVGDR